MAEVASQTNPGGRRRLPVWMLAISSADEKKQSGNEDEKELSESKNLVSDVKPITRKRKRKILSMEISGSESFESSENNMAKQSIVKGTKTDENTVKSIGNFGESVASKKKVKKKTGENDRISCEKSKGYRLKSKQLEEGYPRGSEDEIELTVEDLVSIAEEYVNADRKNQLSRLAYEEQNSETQSRSLDSSKTESGRSVQAVVCSHALNRCTVYDSTFLGPEVGRKMKEIPEIGNCLSNASSSGDAAQDMLDLFLGPLLKKSALNEDCSKAIKEHMNLEDESHTKVRSEAWKEEVPIAKKKSSLRDKVSMFLE